MKNNLKFFFFMMMIFSTLFILSSNSWLNLWIWLEINLINFISYIINNNNKLSIESSLIYFLIQTIASIMLIFSIIMIMFYNNLMKLLMISILLKLGSAPLHYWLPLMIEGLNWMKIMLLLTWQKINPLIMLFYLYNFKFLNLFIIFSMMISSFSNLNYLSMKKIISFSSINQLSWMMIGLNFNKMINLYLLFYFYLMWIILNSLKLMNIKFINQMYNLNINNKFLKLFIFTNFMSMGGLPPFLGFFPKLMVIMKMNNYLILFIMVMFSLIMLFIYLRMMMMMLMLNSMKLNLIKMNKNNKKMNFMMNYSMINNYFILLLMFIY